ncbi:MAG TPA: molecular chaperone DnaJ [Polyangiaceae bacterium]|nr:molecular chaperone DnaJ [Polyangiaceae bacterium]
MDDRTRTPGSDRGSDESCGVCGGDRRIGNSFGLTTTCPSCHGSGRKVETTGFRDVTKTKPSHHRHTNKVEVAEKPQWPVTFEGGQLATEVRDSTICTAEVKTRLIREVMEYEASHGVCTQTFIKKVRKQIRPRVTP